MTKKTWIIFAVLCLAILGGLIYLSRQNSIDVSNVDEHAVQQASDQNGQIGDHTFGNMDSKVVLIEYGDYQCSGCVAAYPIVKQIVQKYKDQMGHVFRNYPLYTSHPNAFAAAATAEVAGQQGKYWEMHDKLYETQSSWSNLRGEDRTAYFANLLSDIGADNSNLADKLTSSEIKRKVDFDQALGEKAGVRGTPSLYINGKDVGNQDVKDGVLIPSDNDPNTPPAWSNADYFDRLVIAPILKEHGLITE